MDPIVCGSCGTRFPVIGLTEDDRRALEDQHSYRAFAEELRMLLKVRDYFRRHPEAEGRIKPDFIRLLESDDPEVKAQLYAGVPFDEIELPPEPVPVASAGEEDDEEVVDYLRHHAFALGPRLEFVSEEVARLKGSVDTVPCPRCHSGRLHVPPDDWDEFTAGDVITWYWPEWYGIDADGTLHVKCSGWQGAAHWNGECPVGREEPDYEFWRWLVEQKEYHRLVEASELAAIREEWSRRTGRCT